MRKGAGRAGASGGFGGFGSRRGSLSSLGPGLRRSAFPRGIAPVCGCRELFVRKDFPQVTGFVIVSSGSGALDGAVSGCSTSLLAAVVVLITVTLMDLLIYFFTGKCLVCYRCRSEVPPIFRSGLNRARLGVGGGGRSTATCRSHLRKSTDASGAAGSAVASPEVSESPERRS